MRSKRPSAMAAITLPGLLWLAGCSGAPPPPPEPPPVRRPSVLLLVVDTLRADRLGSYGCPLPTSPNLDRLAARGVRLADVTAQWPRTWPSMGSFMSGAWPRSTGIRLTRRVVPDEITMLPEIFKGAGYHTGAVVANYNVGRATGFQQGFDHFVEPWIERVRTDEQGKPMVKVTGEWAKENTDAKLVNDQGVKWLRSIPAGEPFFLWMHYMETHGPYLPPPGYAEMFKGAYPAQAAPPQAIPPYQLQPDPATGRPSLDLAFYKAQYDREVRHADTQIGLFLDEVEEARPGEPLLIVFMSDHGESLDEHGYYLDHGRFSYQPTAHVPVILAGGAALPPGRVLEEPVGLIDVSRSLVELAGLEVPGSFEGTSLVPLLGGEPGPIPAHVFMESGDIEESPQLTVRHGRWKLIEVLAEEDRAGMTGSRFELYDLDEDPGERRNLAAEHPGIVEALGSLLKAYREGLPIVAPGEAVDMDTLDEKSREMLRSLGYIE